MANWDCVRLAAPVAKGGAGCSCGCEGELKPPVPENFLLRANLHRLISLPPWMEKDEAVQVFSEQKIIGLSRWGDATPDNHYHACRG
jgi:hypothetical protein